ncbi:hypothetical protein L7F22_046894 [Adiantum nelumboides]|nr:hypothetical protein [Adiantum nelumboides]
MTVAVGTPLARYSRRTLSDKKALEDMIMAVRRDMEAEIQQAAAAMCNQLDDLRKENQQLRDDLRRTKEEMGLLQAHIREIREDGELPQFLGSLPDGGTCIAPLGSSNTHMKQPHLPSLTHEEPYLEPIKQPSFTWLPSAFSIGAFFYCPFGLQLPMAPLTCTSITHKPLSTAMALLPPTDGGSSAPYLCKYSSCFPPKVAPLTPTDSVSVAPEPPHRLLTKLPLQMSLTLPPDP